MQGKRPAMRVVGSRVRSIDDARGRLRRAGRPLEERIIDLENCISYLIGHIEEEMAKSQSDRRNLNLIVKYFRNRGIGGG